MLLKSQLEEWIDAQRALQFLQEAIQCNTVNPPGNELQLLQKINTIFKSYGIESTLYPTEEGRGNLIARVKGEYPGQKLVLCGHADTVDIGEVAWEIEPFLGEIRNGCIYGRGSTDMKSGVISMMYALIYCYVHQLIQYGELIFAVTYGEETGSIGAQEMMEKKQLTDYDAMIIGEPTNNELIRAHKGVLWVEVESIGKTAHASMPAEGVNAIEGLYTFLAELKRNEKHFQSTNTLLSDSTVTVTTIQGGNNTNVIPDRSVLTLDIRTLPEQDHLELLHLLEEIGNTASIQTSSKLSLKPVINLPPLETKQDAKIIQIAQKVFLEEFKIEKVPKGVNYFTDASVFSQHSNGDILILGPGKPELAHQPNEYVEIEKFKQAIQLYIHIAVEYLKSPH